MADSIEPSWITRVRFTPLRDLMRGDFNGRRNWRHVIATSGLPASMAQLVYRVTRRTRLWNVERCAVAEELIAHFRDGLTAEQSSQAMLDDFGDERAAARLIRRAKKRNRPLLWHLWKYTAWVVRVTALLYLFAILRFYLSRPTVSVDYVAQLNAPDLSASPDDRAWPIYRKALLALGILPYHPDPLGQHALPDFDLAPTDSGWPAVARWLAEHQEGISLIRQGTVKPVLGFVFGPGGSARDPELGWNFHPRVDDPVDLPDDSAFEIKLPALNKVRLMTVILRADARYAQAQHDASRVVADLDAILGMAPQDRDPILIARLVSMGGYIQGFAQIEEVMRADAHLLSTDQLIHLVHRVSAVGGDTAASLITVKGEEAEFKDLVQRMYSDDGHGGGMLTPVGAKIMTELADPSDDDTLRTILLTLARCGITAPLNSRRDLMAEYNRDLAVQTAIFSRPLRDPKSQGLRLQYLRRQTELQTSALLRIRYLPLTFLMGNFSKSCVNAERLLGRRDGIEMGLALEIYRRAHQQYPKTLGDLVPQFCPILPMDRITGERLKYRLIDGRPVIYSVGDDHRDDGGRVPVRRDGEPDPNRATTWCDPQYAVSGDWVLYDMRSPAATTPAVTAGGR